MRVRQAILFCLIIIMILTMFLVPGVIYADGVDVLNTDPPLIDFTDEEFEASVGGVPVTDLNHIPQDAQIRISYAFDVLDLTDQDPRPAYPEVLTGDYFTINLPDELTSIASFTEVNSFLSFLDNGNTVNIATLHISTTGIATITFLEPIEIYSEVSASFTIEGQLNNGAIGNGDIVTFSLVAGGTIYTIGFEDEEPPPPPPAVSIEKSGSYNPSTNEITWTVTVDSGGPAVTVNNLYIVDTPGPYQDYIAGSSSIGEPVFNSGNGTYTFSIASLTGTASFNFKTRPSSGAFGAEGSTSTLTNRADIYAGAVSGDPLDTASASVSVTTDWIQKRGILRTDNGMAYIDWTITLNNNNRIIPAASAITDTLPTYLTIDSSSVRRNGSLPSSFGDNYTAEGQQLTYNFSADAAGLQIITFTTSVDPSYYRQQSVTGFTNTATLTIGAGSYSATSNRVGVPTSLLAKSGQGYNASTQLITWRMQVNSNGQAVNSAMITETIGTNQLFAEDFGVRLDGSSTSITRVDNIGDLTITAPQYYYNAGTKELSIYLGDLSGTDRPVLLIQTTVTNPNHYAINGTTNYTNTATLEGNGSIELSTSTGTQAVQSLVLAKSGLGYNYNTRVLSWRITVNQNNMLMPNAVITDVVPAGQEYVAGSLQIDGNAPSAGELNVNGNTLTVTLGEITNQKIITFSTVVTDLSVFLAANGNITFLNSASLSSGIQGAPVVNVFSSQTVNNQTLTKELLTEYTIDNGYIEWEVYINSNQAPMQNAILTDTLQSGLDLNVESIELYYWNQNASGNRTIGTLVPSANYSFSYDYQTRVFLFNLPDGPQGYYLKFKTDVVAPGIYSNTISFSGTYTGNGSASSAFLVTSANIDSSATGTNGSITLNKVDQDGNPIATGAVFELLDSLRNVKSTLTTSANGTILFDRLKLRTYYIREKTPAAGYALNTREIMVTLTSANNESRNQIVTFENSLLEASIILKKTNTQGTGLAGGRYSIYSLSDTSFSNPLQTVLSEGDGLIVFSGMHAGDYAIREVQPPPGYYGTNEVRYASLVLNTRDNTLADITVDEPFVNQAIPAVKFGSIELLKVNEKNEPLKMAGFALYDSEGKLVQTARSSPSGWVVFKNVPFGKYRIREVAAPEGYSLSDVIATADVASQENATEAEPYKIVNKQLVSTKDATMGKSGRLGLLGQSGSFLDNTLILSIGALLILAGLIIAIFKAIKSKRT